MGTAGAAGRVWLGAIVAAAWIAVALALMPAYGPTWDSSMGDFAFGERVLSYLLGGGPAFMDAQSVSGLVHRAPHPEFPFDFHWDQLFPLASTLSAACCHLLWDGLGIYPAIYAHHLVNIVFVALLVWVLFVFTARRAGTLAGAGAVLLLLCSPCFFGHAFNNLKDVPEACLYGVGVIAALAALCRGGACRWMLAGACIGMALAQKANAVFIPVQMGLWIAGVWIVQRARGREFVLPGFFKGLAFGTAAFVLAYAMFSPQLWGDPFDRFGEHLDELIAVGTSATGDPRPTTASTDVSWHGPLHFLITTPPLLLALGLLGAIAGRMDGALRVFLVLWVLVPVGRTALPGMRDFDGVRHFLEFYPGLAALAAFGVAALMRWTTSACERLGAGDRARRAARSLAFTSLVLPGFLVTLDTHPNGICYFNSFVGGLGGAQRAGLEDATDYWGNSYWQGLDWLDAHAAPGANLLVPIAPWVVSCSAPARLRSDLHLLAEDEPPTPPLYVMYITRSRPPLVRAVEALPAAHEIRVQGGTILRIVELADAAAVGRVTAVFDRKALAAAEKQRLFAWLIESKARFQSIWELAGTIAALEREAAEAQLKRALPATLHPHAHEILWLLDEAERQLMLEHPELTRAAAGELLWSRLSE